MSMEKSGNVPTNFRRISEISYLVFLLYITLVPHYENNISGYSFVTRLLMKPFIHEPTNFVLDLDPAFAIIGNIVLFSPLFLLLNHYNKSLNLEACLIICALSPAIIEILQRWIPGRVSSASDLTLNVIGLMGVYLFVKFGRRVQS